LFGGLAAGLPGAAGYVVNRTASGAFDGEAQHLTLGQQAVACAAPDFRFFHGKHLVLDPSPL
jgi:hypothetical protein